MDLIFIAGHILHAVFIGAFIVYSYKRAPVWHFNLIIAFAALFAVEFEIFHEMCRQVGYIAGGPDVDARVRYLFCVYFALGLFYREVIFYAEKRQ